MCGANISDSWITKDVIKVKLTLLHPCHRQQSTAGAMNLLAAGGVYNKLLTTDFCVYKMSKMAENTQLQQSPARFTSYADVETLVRSAIEWSKSACQQRGVRVQNYCPTRADDISNWFVVFPRPWLPLLGAAAELLVICSLSHRNRKEERETDGKAGEW